MTANFNVLLFILLSFALTLTAQEFICPTAPITKDAGLTGVLPAGATGQVQVPANTTCTYTFQIPKGFALRVDTTADYEVSMENSINFDNIFISPPAVNVVDYAMNTEVPFEIVSKTGDLAFITKYSYIDLSNYKQVIIPTGTHLNTTLDPNKYYTVKASNDNDQVNLQYGSRQSSVADLTLSESAKCLRKAKPFYSTSNTVTLVNLYGNPSSSLFLGNDASVIKTLNNYGVLVMDSDKEYDDWMYLLKDATVVTDSWYTVICKDCTTFSIDYMLFDTDKDYSNANGFVEVQGMTPSHKLQTMLHYQYSTSNNQSFPQIIPAPMATFHLYNSSFHFKLRPGTLQKDFDTSSGATRYVSSPQLWNPDAKSSFDYTFSDFNKNFNFSINLQSLKLENDGDSLNVEVGTADGDNSLDKKYTKTSLENQQIAGIGSYLKLVYTGTKNSTVLLNFEMIDMTETTVSMETTTKESVSSLPLWVLIVMPLFVM
ncbi:hypothetical protein GCK72_020528 [Caenorhabditis remanei]|uniref:CUB-like domain-containing protein n=1 Tax=Caenorhabditis remanei TaxID=31234 RepID=A0A6A5GH82_CAERE|nr:hypothetical protein GCK72_020528 [Caenorhabditis remanei]KAF1753971.1 hypothetical protein GCK72_020528 [Caenorhabditis remanei]